MPQSSSDLNDPVPRGPKPIYGDLAASFAFDLGLQSAIEIRKGLKLLGSKAAKELSQGMTASAKELRGAAQEIRFGMVNSSEALAGGAFRVSLTIMGGAVIFKLIDVRAKSE